MAIYLGNLFFCEKFILNYVLKIFHPHLFFVVYYIYIHYNLFLFLNKHVKNKEFFIL